MIILLAWILLRVGLNPLGNVVVLAVLPGAEPEQDQLQVVLTRTVYEQIYVGEVELAGRGLHHFPIDGCLDRVDVEVCKRGPDIGKGTRPGA